MEKDHVEAAVQEMTVQQQIRFKYWENRTILASIVGYAMFYFVRKNISVAMPFMNQELGISKSDLLTSTMRHPNRPPKNSHRKVERLIYALV